MMKSGRSARVERKDSRLRLCLLDEPLRLVTVDVHLAANVIICIEGNLLYHLIVAGNETLAGENPDVARVSGDSSSALFRYEKQMNALEQIVVADDRCVIEGPWHALVVRIVDQIARTEVETSKSSDGATNAES